MWFLALLVSFMIGLFSSLQLFLCLFYGLPYTLTLPDEFKMTKRKYIISTFIHSLVMIIAVVLMSTVLKSVWWAVFIGFIIIPFIISIFQRENAIKEIMINVKQNEKNVAEKIEISYIQKIQNLYEGKLESFSMIEIAKCAINLEDFKSKLPPEKFNIALMEYTKYISNPTNQVPISVDLSQFNVKILEIQEIFEEIIGEQILFDGTLNKSQDKKE